MSAANKLFGKLNFMQLLTSLPFTLQNIQRSLKVMNIQKYSPDHNDRT